MVLTFIIAFFTACGLLLVVRLLAEALRLPVPGERLCHVVRLEGDAAQVEQTVKSCLRMRECSGLQGKWIFVDWGIGSEAQMAVEVLLRREEDAILCSRAQLQETIGWEKERFGAGTD